MIPNSEKDGAGGQRSRYRTYFSVTTSEQLSKRTLTVAWIIELRAIFICLCLLGSCSTQNNMILNLGGRVFLPSFAFHHHLSCCHLIIKITQAHTRKQQRATLLLLDSWGCCGGGAPFFISHSSTSYWAPGQALPLQCDPPATAALLRLTQNHNRDCKKFQLWKISPFAR